MKKKFKVCAIIEGNFFIKIFEFRETNQSLYKKFLKLWMHVDTCLFCRVSDSVKPNIVKMVTEFDPKLITMAIGDGANDLRMLKAAHVGVGISNSYDK